MGGQVKNILVVALVLINLATLATIWSMRQSTEQVANPRAMEAGERPSQTDFLADELDFTDTQKQALVALRQQHFKQMKAEHDKLRNLRQQLHGGLSGEDYNIALADSLSAEMGKQFAAMELLVAGHFREIRTLCSPQQEQKFDEVVEEVLRMGPPDGAKPPRGHRPGPGKRPR